MVKRLSESHKREMVESFVNGDDIKNISQRFNFSSQTITKQLKNKLGEEEFKKIRSKFSRKNKTNNKSANSQLNKNLGESIDINVKSLKMDETKEKHDELSIHNSFFEVIPLTEGVELNNQKDIASKAISDFELPEVVYILVDKKTELEPKMLKHYPDWSFMPQEDLERMTLEIYSDQKSARQSCSKDQKLIKIPNSQVFLITSKYLKARGITRIIFKDALLSI